MVKPGSAVDEVLVGGGACGELLRRVDWARTPIGPVEHWPQSLRTTVGILLASNYPLYLAWGPRYVQMYNDAYRPICGATKHPAALGQEAALTWPEVWHVLGPAWEGIFATGEPIRVENLLMLLDRNGYLEECYFSYSHSPIRDETGGVGGIFAALNETTDQVIGGRRLRVIRDLSLSTGEQATPRDACREAMRVLATSPNDVPFALLYLLEEGAPGTARLMGACGLAEDEPRAPLTVTLDAPGAPWPLAEVLGAGEPVLLEASRLPPGAGPLPGGPWPEGASSVLLQPLLTAGQTRGVGVLVTGISPRRALDEDYRNFLALAARAISSSVAGATAREQERRRAEALAQLDRAKTAFFNNISHEFRTPLALMMGPLDDSLQDAREPLGTRQRERVETIRRNGLRLLKLVNTLLEFSRIEAGRARASFAPTDLSPFTEGLASAFRSTLEGAGLRLRVECPPVSTPVWVDREMWEKIVLNLVSNAFKFTFEGEVGVCLRELEDRVELSVSDTGVGIPTEELPRIFERFHRVQGSRGRSYEGSGIGLALVNDLVKLHHGDLRVVSTPGQGTTFTVSLPLGHEHLPADQRVEAPTPVSPGTSLETFLNDARGGLGAAPGVEVRPRDPRGGHVLLVEDNADMRAYVSRLLEERYTVETADNGLRALECIAARRPDLVLSDVMMPGLDGFGLLRRLRADPHTRALPVILLSARAGEESTIEGLEQGANDYLVKPFSARELLARVEGNLAAARAREQTRQSERERAKLAAVVEQSSEFVGIADVRGHVYYINDAGRRLVGLGRDEPLEGRRIADFFSEQDQPFVRDSLLPSLSERDGWEGELRFRHFVTGASLPVLYNVFPVKDSHTGEMLGFAAVTRDISELKRREEEARQRAEFEKQLIGIVSHDLRNPISAILLSAQLLGRGELDERTRRTTQRIASSAERARRLVHDLLDFTQARLGGSIPIERSPRDFHETVGQVLEEIRAAHPARRVVFLHEGSGLGEWDGERLGQVVQNLVTNALRYSPPDTPVQVTTVSEGEWVVLRVHNRGTPIPESLLPRLFQAMQRGDDTERTERSVGLGLFIVQHVVRAHGGRIDVASTAQDGTTFTVWLPRRAERGVA